MCEITGARAPAHFERVDVNGDGILTVKEINDSMTEKERRKYDIDGDGEISVVEFLKFVNYAEC